MSTKRAGLVAAQVAELGHRLGTKQIFLPNFVLTLIRTPKLPPTYATFIVPLNLNKFDLRDYLWHAYGVKVNAVRSYIQQQKITQDKPGAKRPKPRKWYRPRSIKKMTVEMEMPFAWPKELEGEELDQWDKKTFDAAKQDRTDEQERYQPDARTKPPEKERDSISEQAKALLRGEERWKSTGRLWEDVGEEVEVETDVELPKIGE